MTIELPTGAYYIYRVNYRDEYANDGNVVGYWTEKSDAAVAAEHEGWYGVPGNVRATVVIKLDDKIYGLAQARPIVIDITSPVAEQKAKKRQIALDKLTLEERKLLGV